MITTAESSLISPEQAQQFAELGYCVVSGLYCEGAIQEIEDFFEEFKATGGRNFDRDLSYAEIDKTKDQVRALHPHRHSKRVEQWALNPKVAEVLEVLLGTPALLAQTMYYFKPPGAKGQGMHQDNFYLLAAPATCIAAWTAIDGADNENGCLWVVPKSNLGDIRCPEGGATERWMEYGDTHIGKFPREQPPVAVPVPRGSTMFFGGNLIHGSGPNRTKDRWRRTFIGHYIDSASDEVARFYHPVLDMQGRTIDLAIPTGGGPCGDGWVGATH
jgi:ectoine hydroxylase-related dioxygenase (phytanoyl-CoA dioxygenase family)